MNYTDLAPAYVRAIAPYQAGKPIAVSIQLAKPIAVSQRIYCGHRYGGFIGNLGLFFRSDFFYRTVVGI